MERFFVDTSAWVALVNAKDPDHRSVRDTLNKLSGRLITSNLIFDESVTLCRYRMGHRIACRVGDAMLSPDVVDLIRASAADERAAWKLFHERSDKEYSFTDCTSFVLMRRLAIETAIALDADFAREGFRVLP
jgi:uncharacterized protein